MKGYDNVSFTLKEKSHYIHDNTRIFGGKKTKVFSYRYPKDSIEIKKEQLYFGATLNITTINISPVAERELFKRLSIWFEKNKRHKGVIVAWKKL